MLVAGGFVIPSIGRYLCDGLRFFTALRFVQNEMGPGAPPVALSLWIPAFAGMTRVVQKPRRGEIRVGRRRFC